MTFGFMDDAPSVGSGEPLVAVSGPNAPSTTESSSDVSTVAETIGNSVELFPEPTINLDGRQKKNIQLLARGLFVMGQPISGEAIWNLWPEGMNKSGTISASITDPEERGRVFRAGLRPSIIEIQNFLRTGEYRDGMRNLGIEINPDDNGLTAEQLGFLTILSNPADGRDLKRKLSHAGITWAKYQVWLKQPDFSRAYNQIVSETLKDMMPMAKQQLAAKIGAGDLTAIKFGMEVTGEHDPNGKKQLDAQAFLGVILEVLEEEVKDQEILQRIATKITLRGQRAIEH